MNKIIITVKGGVIQNIQNVPEKLAVIVQDFDTDGMDPDKLSTTKSGDEYLEYVWEFDR